MHCPQEPAKEQLMQRPDTIPLASVELLASAQRSLIQATVSIRPGERYAAAHLCALRAAAAIVALYGTPQRRRVRSVWQLLAKVAPEFTEWAEFFAAGAVKRAAAEAGLPSVTIREADDLVRDAETFLDRVRDHLGVPQQLLATG
jgi:hypothetical protein